MSIKLLSAAWELDIGSTEKMVLMCLCDYANDDGGNCWPSVATIARKCSKSERTVQGAIRELERMTILRTVPRRGTSNAFQLDPRKICTPAKSAPPQKTAGTPAKSAPKPPRTVNNKTKGAHALPANWEPIEFGPKSKSRKIIDGWPPGHLEEQLERFEAHHRKLGNKFDDWQAAWATWVLNSEKFKHGDNIRRGGATGPDRRSGLARAIDAELDRLSAFPEMPAAVAGDAGAAGWR